jgi:phosphoribosylformylglycinamidine synthase II
MAAVRIEIAGREGVRDVRGERAARGIRGLLGATVESVRTIDVFTVAGSFTPAQLRKAAAEFCDPVTCECAVGRPLARDFDLLIEVGFLPGVTDNAGRTAGEALASIVGRPLAEGESVHSSVQYLARGGLTRGQAEQAAAGALANELIQDWRIVTAAEFDPARGLVPRVPRVSLAGGGRVRTVPLAAPDQELLRISREGTLALSLVEMKAIAAHYDDPAVRRAREGKGLPADPTDVELEVLAQTWSEHCKHKIFNARIEYDDGSGRVEVIDSLFRECIRRATEEVRASAGGGDICLSVFADNAGVIRFTDDHHLVFKVETHNSPSALDPYGGALTGILGVNRDPFGTGQGAALLFNTDVFCFADPFRRGELPPRILHPRRIYEGVVEGVQDGGNKSGIPTVNGAVVFDERYLGKPLVYCGTCGILPARLHGRPSWEKKAEAGDAIVMTGGRIGKDGIHGATFSSEELHQGSPATAVQIGDPITQKRMFDFLLRARDRGLYRSLTDDGAGGLSSSVGEMAQDTGGAVLHLERAPLKYAGLDPWEILLSEAQERMTLAVPPEKVGDFLALSRKMGVESTVLGEFTASGYLEALYEGRTVGWLPMGFLHQGVPQMRLTARWRPPVLAEPAALPDIDPGEALLALLSRLNLCSKESIVRRYDHEVQGGSVVKPFTGAVHDGPSDAGVVRPVLDSFTGVVVGNGIIPRYSDIDAYHMAACSFDEALRNYVAVGGDPGHAAALDNFSWCDPVLSEKNPDGDHRLAQLVRANRALYHAVTSFGVPLVSGKDSMKNDYVHGDLRISVPPTLLVSVVGRIPDVRAAVTMDLKAPGNHLYLLGETRDELGAGELYAHLGLLGANVPRVDFATARKRYRALHLAMRAGLVRSCHDLSDGGLAPALAEMAFAGGVGARLDLARIPGGRELADLRALFSESASRLLVEVEPERAASFEAAMAGTAFARVGETMKKRALTVKRGRRAVLSLPLDAMREAWQAPLREL